MSTLGGRSDVTTNMVMEYEPSDVHKLLKRWEGREKPVEMIGWFTLARAYVETERELHALHEEIFNVQKHHSELTKMALHMQKKMQALAQQMNKLMIPEDVLDDPDDAEPRIPTVN